MLLLPGPEHQDEIRGEDVDIDGIELKIHQEGGNVSSVCDCSRYGSTLVLGRRYVKLTSR